MMSGMQNEKKGDDVTKIVLGFDHVCVCVDYNMFY